MKDLTKALLDLYSSVWDRFLGFLHGRPTLAFFLLITLVVICAGISLSIAEGAGPSAYWQALVYILSGLDVDPPQTAGGEAISVLVLICGVVIVSLFTGYVAAEFNRLLTSAVSVPRKSQRHILSDHIIFLGWGAKTKAILRELDSEFKERGLLAEDIVVVSPHERLEREPLSIYQHVTHVRGNLSDSGVIDMCNLAPTKGHTGANVAVVVSDSSVSPVEADRKSLLNLLAIEHMHPAVNSLVDVFEHQNAQHFQNANADEIMLPSYYATLLLARAAEFPGIAGYVDELLALAPNKVNLGELDTSHAPVSFYIRSAETLGVVGMSMPEAIIAYNAKSDGIITALLRDNQLSLFGENVDANTSLQAGDQLVVIATPEQG